MLVNINVNVNQVSVTVQFYFACLLVNMIVIEPMKLDIMSCIEKIYFHKRKLN